MLPPAYNKLLKYSHVQSHFHETVRGIYGDVDSLDNLISNYMSISHKFPISEYEGAKKLLESLKIKYKIGLLTAADNKLVPMALAESGIPLTHFDYIQTSSDTPFHKPDPQVFEPALAHFGKEGVRREDILYVGDAVSDAQAAIGAGINFVGLYGHTTEKSKFDELNTTSFPDFTSLLDYLS